VGTGAEWRRSEVIAWTEHDGVGAPPRGPGRTAPLTLAAALGATIVGLIWNDTLCPEHRSWVYLLAGIALVGTIAAIVGLIQGWAMAPLFTVFVALIGVSIGLIDAVHEPTTGRLAALAFGACAVLAAVLAARSVPLALWERRVRRGLVAHPVPQDAPTTEPVAAPRDAVAEPEPEPAPRLRG
jgi:hypothetical protein